jgi:hypothetical protein
MMKLIHTICVLSLCSFAAACGDSTGECGDTSGDNFLDGSFCPNILSFEEVEIDYIESANVLRIQYGNPTPGNSADVSANLEITVNGGTEVLIEQGRTYGPEFLTVSRRPNEGANLTGVTIDDVSMGVTLDRYAGVGQPAEGEFAFRITGSTRVTTLVGGFRAPVEEFGLD